MKKSNSNLAAGLTRILIVLAICTFLIPIKSFAQQFTPVLIAKSKDTTFRMPLVSADLKIKLNDQRVSFKWLLVYHNPTKQWMEGELSMPMLNIQLITGFDMNIGNVLRKGMLAEKQQAKTVYERIVSSRCDPGLLEIINGNTFKLRIFPIMGEELKTVRLSYECDYEYKDGIFSLNYPFDFIDNLKEFNIEIDAEDMSGTPFIESNIDGLKFNDSKFAEKSIENFSSKNFFKIMFRNNLEQPLTVFSEFNDELYFSTLYKSPLKFAPKEKIEHLTLIVDASYSQRKNNFYPERHFLKEYLKRINYAEIKVIVFSLNIKDEKTFSMNEGNSDEIISYLEKVEYLGATNYGCLNLENLQTDQILFLSNGVNNMGEFKYPKSDIPIYFLNSNPDYDESFIRRITDKTNGRFINLAKNSEVFSSLDLILKNSALMQKIGFAKSDVSDIQFTKYNENPDIYRITGKMKEDISTIYPIFVNREKTDSIVLDTDITELSDDISIPRLWANSKVSELSSATAIDTAEIVQLSKKHSFATKLTSFIVLERVEQYYWFNIEPPPDLVEKYAALLDEVEQQEIERKKDDLKYEKQRKIRNEYKAKSILSNLKINYFDEHKPIFDKFLSLSNNYNKTLDIFNSLYIPILSKSNAGLILPEQYILEREKYSILDKIIYTKDGLQIDSSRLYSSYIFYESDVASDIDKILIRLKNNDTLSFPVQLRPGIINMLDIDIFKEFRSRGLGFSDLKLNITDFGYNPSDSVFLVINNSRVEKIENGSALIFNLLSGKNKFLLYDKNKIDEFELSLISDSLMTISRGTEQSKDIFKDLVITHHSESFGTLAGIVRDSDGTGLRGSSVFIEGTQKGAAVRESPGNFIVTRIMPGEYTVRFSFTGKSTVRKNIKIESGKTTFINIVLDNNSNQINEMVLMATRDESETFIELSAEDNISGDGLKFLDEYDDNSLETEINTALNSPERIFELTEKLINHKDSSSALLVLSSIYDIDMESAKNMFKASSYFSRLGKLDIALDAIHRSSYMFENGTLQLNFFKARIFENQKMFDSAIVYYNLIEKEITEHFFECPVIGNIEIKKINSIQNKTELPDDEKLDLIIRSESYDFQHHLKLTITDSIGISSNKYKEFTLFGGFMFDDPTDNYYFIQKQAVPGKYKIKAQFNTWNNQTEKIKKYRGRIIIERNIGSANYEKKIIEVEADSLEKEIEIEI